MTVKADLVFQTRENCLDDNLEIDLSIGFNRPRQTEFPLVKRRSLQIQMTRLTGARDAKSRPKAAFPDPFV
ncbi:hypothetical protein [Martelella sp. HB161492]|uniref:hypothetical protein n=1 Tax=Martelella sp. HB161492 TaxID=2720726 RepID=UPI001591F4B5|nr:hypothetical protein [Martelella sp. HB161492]